MTRSQLLSNIQVACPTTQGSSTSRPRRPSTSSLGGWKEKGERREGSGRGGEGEERRVCVWEWGDGEGEVEGGDDDGRVQSGDDDGRVQFYRESGSLDNVCFLDELCFVFSPSLCETLHSMHRGLELRTT